MKHKALVIGLVLCCTLTLGLTRTASLAQEHPGKTKEHPGKTQEHPGKAKEHPGKPAPPRELSAEEIRTAIREHIDGVLKVNTNLFPVKDTVAKPPASLKLEFVKVHDDKVSIIKAKKTGETDTYFACTDFKDPKTGTVYDLDFWMKQQANGKLKVVDTKIHKVGGQARYTYEGDTIVDIPVKKG
ncbi:MAG: hypothetical protein AB1489_12280 [Acidobacteriota bacterium]